MVITSKQNSRVKYATKLQIKKYRDQEQKFLVEGYYPIKLALKNDYPLEEIFLCRELLREKFENESLLAALKNKNVEIIEVSPDVYKKISDYESPEGLIAIAPQKYLSLDELETPPNGLYLVAESVEKLSTLGQLFRLADTAGVSAVILCDSRADMFNPQVIRTSLGTFFTINIAQSSLQEVMGYFRDNNIQIIATTPQASQSYTKIDLTRPSAIVLGTEHGGLSNEWLRNADLKVSIPMFGQVESLSIASAAAIMLYEAVRQRTIQQ